MGGKVGEEAGGVINPKARQLELGAMTAQASIYSGKGVSTPEHRRRREVMAEAGLGVTDFGEAGGSLLPEEWTKPMMEKMGKDIQENAGNVPFDALQGIVEDSAASIQRWSERRDEEKDKKGFWGGAYSQNVKKRQAKIAKAEEVMAKQSDRLANA